MDPAQSAPAAVVEGVPPLFLTGLLRLKADLLQKQ
jgi:hypothetical protein